MRAILMLFIMSVIVPLSFFSPFAGLLAFVWTAYFRPQDWAYDPHSQYSLAIAVATLIGYLLFELPRRIPALKENILIILLWAQLSLSTITAFSPPEAWPKYLEFSKILFMAVLMTSMLYNEKRVWWFLLVLLGTIGYLVVRANAAIIIKRGDVKIFGVGGTIEDNNDYALLMALTFPIYYYFAAAQEKRWLKTGFYLLSGMSLVAGLFTFSRGGLLGLVVAVFGLIFKAKRKFIGLGIVLVLGLVFLAVAPQALLERWRTLQTARTEDESAQQRFRSWEISGRIIRDHPLVGVGSRNILLVYYQYADPNESAFVSHNAYLQIATDAGLPALLLFLSILGVSFVRLRKTRRILRIYAPDSPLIKYSHGIEVGLWGYMMSAMFASRQDSEMLFAAIALATSFVIIAREYEQEAKTREFVRKQSQQLVREPRPLTPGLDAA